MDKFKEIWESIQGKTATLVIFSFAMFVVLFFMIQSYTSKLSNEMDDVIVTTISIEKEDGHVYVVDSDMSYRIRVKEEIANDITFERIYSYLLEVRRRHDRHENTMIFFYEQYFLFNMMQAVMIMATTIIGLVVSKYGWEKINKEILYIFFIIAGFVAFVKLVPEFMKVEDNINANKKQTIVYANIEQSILSYLSTGENAKGVNISPIRYVHLLDKEMNGHNNISFDIERIPDQEFDFGKKD